MPSRRRIIRDIGPKDTPILQAPTLRKTACNNTIRSLQPILSTQDREVCQRDLIPISRGNGGHAEKEAWTASLATLIS